MRKLCAHIMFLITITFIYLPLVILVIYSFNNARTTNIWSGFSFKWYTILFADSELLQAFYTSIKVAAVSASLSLALGLAIAIIITRIKFSGSSVLSSLSTLPFVVPEIITGMTLLITFIIFSRLIGWPTKFGFDTVIIAHATIGMAYVTLLLSSRLSHTDISLEEAAQDLGATPIKAFFSITLPLMLPSLISAWVLSFTISLDDLIIATFTSGAGFTTLPMLIYSRVKLGVTPEINVLATLFMLCIIIIATILTITLDKKETIK
jgi:putrescine transport system permease protein